MELTAPSSASLTITRAMLGKIIKIYQGKD